MALAVVHRVLLLVAAVATLLIAGTIGAPQAHADTVIGDCTIISNPNSDNRTVCPEADLSGADLSGHNLSYANLDGANLTGTNLTDANLTSTDPAGVFLPGVNLTGAKAGGVLLIPADVAVTSPDGDAVPVSWDVATLKNATESCNPSPGASFGPGATKVTCTVASIGFFGTTRDVTFTVTVNTPPVSTAAPVITASGGASRVVAGDTVTCEDGTWDGYPAPSLAYTFEVFSAGSWMTVQGPSTSSTYTIATDADATQVRCAIAATNTAAPNPTSAGSANTLPVGKLAQSVSFTSTPPASAVEGDSYQAAAQGSDSGNPVTFTGTTGVCTVDDNALVSLVGVGQCTITATQAGSHLYEEASATQVFSVAKVSASTPDPTPTTPVNGGAQQLPDTGAGSATPLLAGALLGIAGLGLLLAGRRRV